MTFEQDGGFPVNQVVMEIDGDGTIRHNEKAQKDLTDFAEMWMKNIQQQQEL